MQGNPPLVIEAGRTERHYWRDLWRYRELFLFLAWRDILVRYKQTVIGVAWSVIRPVATMVVFTIVFGRIARLPSDGVPYPILVFSALLPWHFFASAVAEGSNSLIENANIISGGPGTDVIVMMGEIGGTDEQKAAEFVKAKVKKPVVGFIAGQTAPPGRRMGHAGAIISGHSGTAAEKMAAFEAAGIAVMKRPIDVVELVKARLK